MTKPEQDFEPDRYFDHCCFCGQFQEFVRAHRLIRETYRCAGCHALLREREQARALLDGFESLGARSLAELVEHTDFRRLRIYEPGTIGGFRRFLKGLPYYQQSIYYPEAERGKATAELPHGDLEALGFADASFDLVITSDILEHVRRPRAALAEIARILRPGGWHVFTVPLQHPAAQRTVARVDTSTDEDRMLLPAAYHGDGRGGRSLVYNDFGLDIVELLNGCGFSSHLKRPATASPWANRLYTVVSRRHPA